MKRRSVRTNGRTNAEDGQPKIHNAFADSVVCRRHKNATNGLLSMQGLQWVTAGSCMKSARRCSFLATWWHRSTLMCSARCLDVCHCSVPRQSTRSRSPRFRGAFSLPNVSTPRCSEAFFAGQFQNTYLRPFYRSFYRCT